MEITTRPHIVVVNDTQEILELFREILEEEGFRVSLYSYAFSDIHSLVELQPDLVLLDFIIGGEDMGWQMLQKMKMDRRTANIPVVVCSAAKRLLDELDGHLQSKGVGVVLKPFDIDEMVEEVRHTLKQADEEITGAPVN